MKKSRKWGFCLMIKAVFFGTGPVAAASLEALAADFEIELVITKARIRSRDAAPVEDLASEKNLPIKFANNQTELDDLVTKTSFQSKTGIVVDYGVIMSAAVINTFPLGIINSHFSKLPQWRGADPITFAILSGQKSTAVSLMLIEPTLDTGKLIAQKSLLIAPDETTPSLTTKLIQLSNKLLQNYIPRYAAGEIQPRRQPHVNRDVSYSRKLTKADGQLDPATMTAVDCERKVRAFLDFPRTRISFHGTEIIVTKAHIESEPSNQSVKCADQKYLVIDELISPTSGKKMKTADYLNGLRF
ncbi:MAG: hypothetical protein LBL08_02720 [Candidatus Nomurabacteria bacterium]|nr:hypothetical protein [Candidatus Nomurabacteria bacterium]